MDESQTSGAAAPDDKVRRGRQRSTAANPRRDSYLPPPTAPRKPSLLQRINNRSARHLGRMNARRRTVVAGIAMAATLAIAAPVTVTMMATTAGTAQAATTGVGIEGASAFGGYLGSYTTPEGEDGYCADPSRDWPSGATSPSSIVTSFTSDTGFVLQGAPTSGISAAYKAYGHGDAVDRAAFNALIYAYTGSNLGGGIQPGTQAEGAAYISSSHPEILAKYNEVWNYAQSNANANAGASTPVGPASYTFTLDANNLLGTMTVHTGNPAGVVPTTTLTGGVFVSTGTSTIANLHDGETVSVRWTPADGQNGGRISASGTVSVPGGAAQELKQWDTGSQQRLLAGSPNTTGGSYPISGDDPVTRTNKFAPILGTTVASEFVPAGQKPSDVVTFNTTAFSFAGRTVNNPWAQRTDKSYAVVTAKGTLYGPSAAPFTESDTPPAGVLVAGHATVATSKTDGPTTSYTATSDTAVTESGYYTWVWKVDYADQTAGTQSQLPDGYSFTDRFGQKTETHVSPAQVSFTTKLSDTKAAINGAVTDTISPTLTGGAWLQDAGARIPVTLTGTAYWSAEKPKQSPTAPADAVALGTVTQTLGGPTPVTSQPINVGVKTGWVTVQWSLEKSAQPAQYQGYFANFTDDYGVPSETVQVQGPTITTKAQPNAAPGETAHDTAIVDGLIPDGGLDVKFDAYLQKPGTQPVCDDTTRVFTSSKVIHVTKAGEYTSEDMTVPAETAWDSVLNWVETSTLPGTDTVVSQGKCGDTSEQTKIQKPTVVTIPPTGVVEGDTTHDTVKVDGWVPEGTTTTVTLYKKQDGAKQLVCTEETKVQDLAPITLTPGANDGTTYKTGETGKLPAGDYGFVEVTNDKAGKQISQGGCLDELFSVAPKPVPTAALAHTGSDTQAAWMFGGGAAALLLLGGAALMLARRKKEREEADSI